MARYVRKQFSLTSASWTAPAGVTSINLCIIDLNDRMYSTGRGTAILRSNGQIFQYGINPNGALGDGTIVDKSSPVQVVGGHSFIQVSASFEITTALKADGTAWVWGNNVSGGIGDGTNGLAASKSVPTAVIGSHSFVKISTNNNATAALKANGEVWVWGRGTSGKLGDGTVLTSYSSPIQVIGGHSFVEISTGESHLVMAKQDGSLWATGPGLHNGDGTGLGRSSPVQVAGGHSFVSFIASAGNTYALKSDGSLWGWGLSSDGQLGSTSSTSSPVPIAAGYRFAKISAASTRVFALQQDGNLWAWGDNTAGRLGIGIPTSPLFGYSTPIQVVGGHLFTQLSVSSDVNSMGAVKADGTVWTWGLNLSGQLGDGTIITKSAPVQVIGNTLFQTGPRIITERVMNVTPGTSYTFNTFLTQIDNQVIINTVNGNNLTIVVEYYV